MQILQDILHLKSHERGLVQPTRQEAPTHRSKKQNDIHCATYPPLTAIDGHGKWTQNFQQKKNRDSEKLTVKI